MTEFPRHPQLEALQERLAFLRDSYLGGIDYKKEAYLAEYGNEDKDDYERRLKQATYTNYCSSIIEAYNNYLFSGEVTRDFSGLSGVEFEAFMADADMMGRSYEKMIRELSKQAGASGFIGVILDKPEGEQPSKGAEIAAGIRPYMAVYVASSIIDYEMEYINGSRLLTKLILEEETGNSDVLTYKVWYINSWELWEKGKEEKWTKEDKGVYSLGFIPFVAIINRDKDFHPIIGKSDIADIADINNKVYRFDSDAETIIDQCAFPWLQGPQASIDAIAKGGLSTKTAVPVPDADEGAAELKFTEPVFASLPQIMAWRKEAIQDIKDMSKLEAGQQTQQAESGIALEIQFRPLNSLLTEKAENMELAETRILTILAAYLGKTFTGSVQYPREFAVMDLMQEIDIALNAKAAVKSRTFDAEIEKIIAAKSLPDADDKTMNIIVEEIEAEEPEIPDTDDINMGGGDEEETKEEV
jgi:hypothetical protein